jgi:hypothetical protein
LRDQFASRSETSIGAKAGGASILRQVIDGDKTDMRFADPRGVIVGLFAKGLAKADRTGFVVD